MVYVSSFSCDVVQYSAKLFLLTKEEEVANIWEGLQPEYILFLFAGRWAYYRCFTVN